MIGEDYGLMYSAWLRFVCSLMFGEAPSAIPLQIVERRVRRLCKDVGYKGCTTCKKQWVL